jgi:hypothetical protein
MCKTRLHTPPSPNGSCGRRDVAPYRHISAQREGSHCIIAVEHDDEICEVRSYLKTPSDSASGNARRRRPGTIGKTGDDDA